MTLPADVADMAVRLKLTTDKAIDATTGRIAAAWSRAWDEMAQEWREALLELASLAENGQWPTRGQVARSVRAQAALKAASEALEHLAEVARLEVSGDLPALIVAAEQHHATLIAAQLPPGHRLPVVGFDAASVAWMVERTTQQITVLHWPLTQEADAAMRSALIRGIAVGDNPRVAVADMLRRVEGVFNGGRARAENIARTEMIDSLRAAAQQKERQHLDVLKGWRWTAKLDSRVCPTCVERHGQKFALDEPGPLGHPSCRCARTPVTRTWAELGFPGLEEPVRDAPTGMEWFYAQPGSVQRSILGPKRYAAWKNGDYPSERWSVLKPNPQWRASYVAGPILSGR